MKVRVYEAQKGIIAVRTNLFKQCLLGYMLKYAKDFLTFCLVGAVQEGIFKDCKVIED